MANEDFGRIREGLDEERMARINDKTVEYYNAMMKAQREGKSPMEFMDAEGGNALKRFTASANAAAAGDVVSSPYANRIVPTVTETEGGRERSWDLFSLLMKQRVVLLEGQVDDAMASIACASLLYLKSEASGNADGDITVHINSPGGSILAGLAIYDTMRSIKPKITTIGYGMQASMGSILLVAGDERKMTRNSKFMIHQPLSGTGERTQSTDGILSADLTDRLREDLTDIYVRHTGLKHEFWDKVLERDTWLTAEQAKKMGVIEDIIMGTAKRTVHEEFSHRASIEENREKLVPKTAEGILRILNSKEVLEGNVNSFQIRSELVTALSQFEEFWTPSRIEQEKAKKAAAAASAKSPANDDNKTAAPAVKGPSML